MYPDTLIPPLPELTTRNPVTAELSLCENTSIWTTINKFSTSATLNSFIKHMPREKGSGKDQTQVTLNIYIIRENPNFASYELHLRQCTKSTFLQTDIPRQVGDTVEHTVSSSDF